MTAPASPALRGNAGKVVAFSALSHFHLWLPFWVIYLRDERGFSLTEILALDSFFFGAQVLLELPTGIIADRYGRRVSLVAGSALTAAAVLVFGIADSFALVLVSYFVWALGATLVSGADSALLYDTMSSEGRLADYSQLQGVLTAAAPAAGLVAGLIGAPIAARTGMVTPILVSAAITAASAAIAVMLREPPRALHTTAAGVALASIRHVRASRAIRYALAFSALGAAVQTLASVFSQPFLIDHGAALASLGAWQVPLRVAAIAGPLIAYRLALWLGDWRLFALTPLALGISYGVLATWDSIAAFPMFLLIGFVGPMRNPVVLRYVNERTEGSERASVLSIRNLVMAATMAVVQPVGGAIADRWSMQAAFGLVGFVMCTALALIVLAWWRSERLRPPPTSG